MEKVLDVYKRPYNKNNPVICMDESPKQLIAETRSGTPMQSGKPATQDYEYIRHGVCNIFMANEPLKGKRYIEITEQKTRKDWALFVKRIADEWYPQSPKITLVMDNFKTHSPGSLYETFDPIEAKRLWDRFDFVFTPKHGSWLNMAEIELNVLNGRCLNRHLESIDRVRDEVEAWQTHRNNKNATINWQFTAKDARVKLKKLYPSVQA
jgi:hypothetical protein